MKKLACLYKVCTKLDFEQLFLSRLDWRPVTEESQLNAWARAGRQIKLFMSFFLCFLVWPYVINILLTELGRSLWKNLDFGRWYRPHSGDLSKNSPIQTSRSANNNSNIETLDILGFWTTFSWFRIPGIGFCIPWQWNLDSAFQL